MGLMKGHNMQRFSVLVAMGFIFVAASIGRSEDPANEVNDLIKKLGAKSVAERAGAAEALGEIGPAAKAAVPEFMTLLKDDQKYYGVPVACSAATALGRIGPAAKDAIPQLVGMLKSDEWHTQLTAIQTLGEIGPASKDAIPLLIGFLKDASDNESCWRYQRSVVALGNIGEPAVKPLITALTDKNPETRAAAAEAFGLIGPAAKAAIDKLTVATKDADVQVRVNANAAMMAIAPKDKAKFAAASDSLKADASLLVKIIKDSTLSDGERMRACASLGKLGPLAKDQIEALIGLFKDEEFFVRIETARVLSQMGAIAVPALIKASKDTDTNVVEMSMVALEKMGPAAKDAVHCLIAVLEKGPSIHARYTAADALGNLGPKGKAAIPALIKAMKDPEWIMPAEAAKALGNIGQSPKEVVPTLVQALGHEQAGVRWEAAEALGKFGPAAKDALPDLKKLSSDKDSAVQRRVEKAIKRIAGNS